MKQVLTFILVLLTYGLSFSINDYKISIDVFDWGPGVSKVILSLEDTTSYANAGEYQVFASRKSNVGDIPSEQATGKRDIVVALVTDQNGIQVKTGKYITLVLSVGPLVPIGSPIHYFRGKGNKWIDYQLTIIHTKSGAVWNKENGRTISLIDRFDLSGKFKFDDKLILNYAAYVPKTKAAQSPLIIWLHGGGEGGTDPTIPLIGNRAANYASDEIQSIFEGAYVLVPQCPGAWMHNATGVSTHGKEDDIYNKGLIALIKNYIASNPKIDINRIYIGGCSNGGYMALKLILMYPDYFAAGYISSLAYQSQYITDEQIKSITKVPIWFVHSKDDPVTIADHTVVPVFNRLKTAGAVNNHFSFYDHVTDITGVYGGENFYYNGHWSWIYLHANKCYKDIDGSSVQVNGKPVTIMEWLAGIRKIK